MEIYQIIPEIENVQSPTNYTLNVSKILDISSDRNEFLFVVALNEDGEIVIAVLSFNFNKFDAPGKYNKIFKGFCFGRIHVILNKPSFFFVKLE